MKIFLTVMFTILFWATPVQALSIKQVIHLALSNNPNLKKTEQEIYTAEEKSKVARGKKFFSFNSEGTFGITKSNFPVDIKSTEVYLTATMPIYSGRRLESAIKSATLDIDISKLKFAQEQENLIYNVMKSYINALHNFAILQINLDTEKNLLQSEYLIESKPNSDKKFLDLSRAQITTLSAHKNTLLSQKDYEVALVNISSFLSEDSINQLSVDEFRISPFTDDLETFLKAAEANRFDLKADTLRINKGNLQIINAKSNWLPNIKFYIEKNFQILAHSQWYKTSELFAEIYTTWNIFDSGITRAEVNSAKFELERLNLTMSSDLNKVHEEVTTAYKNLQTAKSILETTKIAVELAEKKSYFGE